MQIGQIWPMMIGRQNHKGSPMEVNSIIDVGMSAVMAFAVWWIKTQHDEMKRVTILLNRTREEVAKEYITKAEVHADMNRIIDRLESLDAKLDRLMER